jgi:hypothetical protein
MILISGSSRWPTAIPVHRDLAMTGEITLRGRECQNLPRPPHCEQDGGGHRLAGKHDRRGRPEAVGAASHLEKKHPADARFLPFFHGTKIVPGSPISILKSPGRNRGRTVSLRRLIRDAQYAIDHGDMRSPG